MNLTNSLCFDMVTLRFISALPEIYMKLLFFVLERCHIEEVRQLGLSELIYIVSQESFYCCYYGKNSKQMAASCLASSLEELPGRELSMYFHWGSFWIFLDFKFWNDTKSLTMWFYYSDVLQNWLWIKWFFQKIVEPTCEEHIFVLESIFLLSKCLSRMQFYMGAHFPNKNTFLSSWIW